MGVAVNGISGVHFDGVQFLEYDKNQVDHLLKIERFSMEEVLRHGAGRDAVKRAKYCKKKYQSIDEKY